MRIKYTIVKEEDDPHDPGRPYYIAGSDYDGFNQLEAATVCAILNEAGESLDWDTITADYRWLIVEAIQAEAPPTEAPPAQPPAALVAALTGLLDALDRQYGEPQPDRFLPGTTEYVLDNERLAARAALAGVASEGGE